MGRVHHVPAGLGGLDRLDDHGQSGGAGTVPAGDLGLQPGGGERGRDGMRGVQMDPMLDREAMNL